MAQIRTALLSAWRKPALDPLTEVLRRFDVACLSTGGTADYLRGRGLEVREVADLTGFPEMLDGRVKTLHPAVFGGILADRARPAHLTQLDRHGLRAIDLVAVDLYPFADGLSENRSPAQQIELIDIGGVALLRAAAKNHAWVGVLSNPADVERAARWLEAQDGLLTDTQRRELAANAFRLVAEYDRLIADYLAGAGPLAPALRYGENPHQAARYVGRWPESLQQLGGKTLSYNNLLDLDAGLRLLRDVAAGTDGVAVAILKHTTPCGLALRPTVSEAWQAALDCDPVSAFGGVIVSSQPLDLETAHSIERLFYELVAAPTFSDDVLSFLTQKDKRMLIAYGASDAVLGGELRRSVLAGELVQGEDRQYGTPDTWVQVTAAAAPPERWADLVLAERAAAHLKSNGIALVRGGQLIGAGTGQTSRVLALRQAIEKARLNGFELAGAVLASDGFFPFADIVEEAGAAGIAVLVQPGGSVRDAESTTAADRLGVAMYHTGTRHFRH
mgnify:CR=1 FL=1